MLQLITVSMCTIARRWDGECGCFKGLRRYMPIARAEIFITVLGVLMSVFDSRLTCIFSISNRLSFSLHRPSRDLITTE